MAAAIEEYLYKDDGMSEMARYEQQVRDFVKRNGPQQPEVIEREVQRHMRQLYPGWPNPEIRLEPERQPLGYDSY